MKSFYNVFCGFYFGVIGVLFSVAGIIGIYNLNVGGIGMLCIGMPSFFLAAHMLSKGVRS